MEYNYIFSKKYFTVKHIQDLKFIFITVKKDVD